MFHEAELTTLKDLIKMLVLVVVEVAAIVVAAVGRQSGIEPRRVGTPGLEVRVAQAGVIASSDVVRDALESPTSPPEQFEAQSASASG